MLRTIAKKSATLGAQEKEGAEYSNNPVSIATACGGRVRQQEAGLAQTKLQNKTASLGLLLKPYAVSNFLLEEAASAPFPSLLSSQFPFLCFACSTPRFPFTPGQESGKGTAEETSVSALHSVILKL